MTRQERKTRSPRRVVRRNALPRKAFLRRATARVHTLLLTLALVIAGTLVVLPDSAEARDEPRTVSKAPARTSTPPARTSTPRARTSTPPARTSTPPARTSTPRAKPSSPAPRAKPSPPPTRTSTPARRSAPETRGNDGVTSGGSSRGTREGSVRRNYPTPRTGGGTYDRRTDRDRRGYSGDDYRYRGRDYNPRNDRRGTGYSERRDHRGGHVHTPYCGHGYRGYRGYGYGYRGHVHGLYCGHWPYNTWYRYSWNWPWWPTVYVGAETHHRHDSGAMDLDVRPEEAQIFLDGQYVGVADDYDGFPSYLWLREGTYDVAFYHPGYETIFRQVSIYPGVVIDFEDRMRPGEAIHPDEYGPSSSVRRDARIQRNREKEAAARARRDEWEDVTYGTPERAPSGSSTDATATSPAPSGDKIGRLYVAVLPTDAAVYLDGHFLGTAAELGQLSAGLVVEPGDHVVELVRPGYATAREEVSVPPGEKVAIERQLEKE